VGNYCYQLAFFIPGINPCQANSLKQIRQIWNFLMYPRRLPHNLHLLYLLTLNLGVFFCFAIKHSFAIFPRFARESTEVRRQRTEDRKI